MLVSDDVILAGCTIPHAASESRGQRHSDSYSQFGDRLCISTMKGMPQRVRKCCVLCDSQALQAQMHTPNALLTVVHSQHTHDWAMEPIVSSSKQSTDVSSALQSGGLSLADR